MQEGQDMGRRRVVDERGATDEWEDLKIPNGRVR